MLKLHFLEKDVNEDIEKTIGTILFDLKEAIPSPKPLDNPEESYIVVGFSQMFLRNLGNHNGITDNGREYWQF